MTVDDWHALPETTERYELYEGVLILMPPPDLVHQDIALALAVAMRAAARISGGAVNFAPTGVALSSTIGFEPDALYLSPTRMSLRSKRGIDGAPDIVVEVASRGTRRYDLNTKLPAYFANGVLEVWIADPVANTVSVYFADEPNAPLTAPFGARIPSKILDVGNAELDELPPPPE
jgi:Uma2 family endonuclease